MIPRSNCRYSMTKTTAVALPTLRRLESLCCLLQEEGEPPETHFSPTTSSTAILRCWTTARRRKRRLQFPSYFWVVLLTMLILSFPGTASCSTTPSFENTGAANDDSSSSLNNSRRQLLTAAVGTHTVLVVRILDGDAQFVPEDAETTTRITETLHKILFYGINDPNYPSVQEQFYQCSGGTYLLEPTRDGVLTVTVSVDTPSDKELWREAAAKAVLEQLLDTTNIDTSTVPALAQLRSVADHVTLILPQSYIDQYDPDYRATGEVASSLSTFSSDWAVSLSAYLHEWGHNLGLNHATLPLDPYGDTTSMMGISQFESYLPRKCYNAAQHWALGWYPNHRATVSVEDLETQARSVSLTGFVHHATTTTQQHAVLVELPSQVYLQYNLAQSYNSGVDLYPNQVVLVVQNSDGTTTLTGALADSTSTHQYEMTTMEGSTVTISISVCSWENNVVQLGIIMGDDNVMVDCQDAVPVETSLSSESQSATTAAS